MFDHKTILITGGTGSWGQELTKQLFEKYNPKEVRIYSRGEHKQVQMKIKYAGEKRLKFYVGDVRDKARLFIASRDVDYMFHLAALKHVPVCEENPWEAVLTNVYGTRNAIECAIENKVKKFIDVSTDKAVDPFNLYGVSKSCGEKVSIAANLESEHTSFVCIRAGNVLGTNGSVVPLFKEQITKNNEITITDERMSRFFFPLREALGLIFKATKESFGGEVFVMRMPSAKITDLAQVMVEEYGNENTKIHTIGIRPGEKLYEVLVSRYESARCIDDEDYFIILPSIKIDEIERLYHGKKLIEFEEFNSENCKLLTKDEIREVLKNEGWLKDSTPDDQRDDTYYGRNLSSEELKNVFVAEGWKRNENTKKNHPEKDTPNEQESETKQEEKISTIDFQKPNPLKSYAPQSEMQQKKTFTPLEWKKVTQR